MSKNLNIQFDEISLLISQAKENSVLAVNVELISLYWKIGEQVHLKVESSEWGKSL